MPVGNRLNVCVIIHAVDNGSQSIHSIVLRSLNSDTIGDRHAERRLSAGSFFVPVSCATVQKVFGDPGYEPHSFIVMPKKAPDATPACYFAS
jgi:hypothetical protein